MTTPVLPPHFFQPTPFASSGDDSVGFWPEIPINNNDRPVPPLKRPRNSEATPLVPVPNHNMNLRIPLPPNPLANRRMNKLFFKTRLCEKFRQGTCPYGSSCHYAHGIEEMRKAPPNWQDIVASNGDDRMVNWEEDQNIINRMRLCRKFYNGEECPFGDRCNYRHEDPRKFRETSVISIRTTGPPIDDGPKTEQSDRSETVNSSVDGNWMNLKPASWKTKMCNKWETTGNCPFGDKCHFAHGQSELQKFGGHNEIEMGKVGVAPPKPLPSPANDASLDNTVAVASKKQVLEKFFSKWKGPEKISRIYADWIDDIPLVNQSPSKTEN
ncbi:hypothetical protein IFM89_006778 [Coptis chinensis]|uniref:C3H1-type domain-containing protein n=1 Tax=Coptis chinensis TaxID=261450 RepID=A0A835IAH3_9MAGN|nr:hypothetical protein IFM89_006778 [Coptis chinensis]